MPCQQGRSGVFQANAQYVLLKRHATASPGFGCLQARAAAARRTSGHEHGSFSPSSNTQSTTTKPLAQPEGATSSTSRQQAGPATSGAQTPENTHSQQTTENPPNAAPQNSRQSSLKTRLLAPLLSFCRTVRRQYLRKGPNVVDAVLLLATLYLFYLAAPVIASQFHTQLASAFTLIKHFQASAQASALWLAALPTNIAALYKSLPPFSETVSSLREAAASTSLQDVGRQLLRGLLWCGSSIGSVLKYCGRGVLSCTVWLGRRIIWILMSRVVWGILSTVAYFSLAETVRSISLVVCLYISLKSTPHIALLSVWHVCVCAIAACMISVNAQYTTDPPQHMSIQFSANNNLFCLFCLEPCSPCMHPVLASPAAQPSTLVFFEHVVYYC